MRPCLLFMFVRIPWRLSAQVAPSLAPMGGMFTVPEAASAIWRILQSARLDPIADPRRAKIILRIFRIMDTAPRPPAPCRGIAHVRAGCR